MTLTLQVLGGDYTIHRFPPDIALPAEVWGSSFLSITKTEEELSVVCEASIPLQSTEREEGWCCIKVLGPLDFSLTGILAKLSGVLAEAKISIFAVSSYDTDYLLLPCTRLSKARDLLIEAGYQIL